MSIKEVSIRLARSLVWFGILFGLARCATYAGRVAEPRRDFELGQYDRAIPLLQKYADNHDNDELLYVMDLGLVYHTAGRYQDAINTFLRADKLAVIKDYTSISKEAASVLLSDEIKSYPGEDFEKILIHVYLAIDYTMLHQWEDALVECRKVNHMLDMMISQGKLPYEQNAFAKYLDASLFEARGELDDAFVDYRTVLKWQGGYPYLPAPLLRLADRLHDTQEYEEFKQRFPGVKNYRIGKDQGEVILLLEVGRAPVKVPHPAFRLLPKFVRQRYSSDFVWLRDEASGSKARTYSLYDIEATAIKELDGKTAGIIAKKMAGVVAKELVAAEVANQTHSEAAGLLTSIFLHSIDHADLRSWTTLPAKLQLARLILPAGRHNILLDRVTTYGASMPGIKAWASVDVKPGETVFLNYRLMD